MDTIIIDLYHGNTEDLSEENINSDITGTSESGLNYALYYQKPHRLYYCDDHVHEERILAWSQTSGNLPILDFQNLEQFEIKNKNIRIIINGQGCLAEEDQDNEDNIAGYHSSEFINLLNEIILKLNIRQNKIILSEIIISSCKMAQSTPFLSALTQFKNNFNAIKIILFKSLITFTKNGEIVSFFDEETVTQNFNTLNNDTVTILHKVPQNDLLDHRTVLLLTDKNNNLLPHFVQPPSFITGIKRPLSKIDQNSPLDSNSKEMIKTSPTKKKPKRLHTSSKAVTNE